MILTFAKLQRLSGLTKPTAVKAWLKREGVSYIRDKDGKPFTTLDAMNRRLQRAGDDGFTLEDPEGGLPEKRPVVSGRQKQVGRVDASGRGDHSPAIGAQSRPTFYYAEECAGITRRLPSSGRVGSKDTQGL